MASTVDQEISVDQETSSTFPGDRDPEYLCNDPPNLPNFDELDQDMTTDLDRIEPVPTHRLVGETELSSTNTTASWEKIPEDPSGGGRLSRGEEDVIGHLDEGECAQGNARRTRAKADSGGVPHSAQVMSPSLSEFRKMLAEHCKEMDIGTNSRIQSLEGDQSTWLTIFEGMFRQLEEHARQASETKDLVEQLAMRIEVGKMERAELTKKLAVNEDKLESLEACTKNLPTTPETQHLTDTTTYGG